MRIIINQSCIDKGKKGSVSKCPIALAMKNVGLKNVEVGIVDVDYNPDSKQGYYWRRNKRLPKKIQNFIERFDKGKSVRPIDFIICI